MPDTRTVSFESFKYTWEQVDQHAEKLGYDRSGYIKDLVELDIDYGILNNQDTIKKIKKQREIRTIDIMIFLLLISMLIVLIMAVLI